MLLRASRAAGQLTKEALVGPVTDKVLGTIGKHWKGIAGAGLVGATAAPEISQAAKRSRVGLTPQWLSAQNAGQVPSIPKF